MSSLFHHSRIHVSVNLSVVLSSATLQLTYYTSLFEIFAEFCSKKTNKRSSHLLLHSLAFLDLHLLQDFPFHRPLHLSSLTARSVFTQQLLILIHRFCLSYNEQQSVISQNYVVFAQKGASKGTPRQRKMRHRNPRGQK